MGGAQYSLSVIVLEDGSFRLVGSSIWGAGLDSGFSVNLIIPVGATLGDMLGESTVISAGFVIEGSLSVPGDVTHAELLNDILENGIPEGSFRTVGIGPDYGVFIGHGQTVDIGGWVADILDNAAFFQDIFSPLVIDLDGDGVELTSLQNSTTFFDLDVDGYAQSTGWVSADDALLALDVDGNGIIDDASELFGDQTGYGNGFLALAAHDSNSDGVIDALDTVFSDLVVWQDVNGDGFSAASEMFSLTDVGITSIDLGYTNVNETNAGHSVLQSSTVTFGDGSIHDIDDVYFENDPRASVALLPDGFEYHEDAFKLPALFGYGHIASTWVVLSEDVALRTEAEALVDMLSVGNVSGFLTEFEDFILEWAGVAGIDPDSRNSNIGSNEVGIDARKLTFLEAAYGTGYTQSWNGGVTTYTDPHNMAAAALTDQFDELLMKLASRFMAQSAVSEALLKATDQASFDAILNGHLFEALGDLVTTYSPSDRAVGGDLQPTFDSLVASIEAGDIAADEAILLLRTLQYDLEPDVAVFTAMLDGFAIDNGATDAFVLSYGVEALTNGIDLQIGTNGADTISTTDESIIIGGQGDDVLYGGYEQDTYIYTLGDGSDTILDAQGNMARADKLVLTDLVQDDVSFSRSAGEDLLITMPDGSVITIIDHFKYLYGFASSYEMENITFADGTVLDVADIRAKSISDQKAFGTVVGTSFAETYVHTSGDGSYTISDYGSSSNVDRLVFTDVNSADVVMSRNVSNDLVIDLSNGETITVIDQFRSSPNTTILYYQLEEIEFADGIILAATEIWTPIFTGTSGDDTVSFNGSSADAYDGSAGNDSIFTNAGNDTLWGGDGDDTLDGFVGNDFLYGGAGNDLVLGNSGSDYYDGGAGNDTVDFTYYSGAVEIDLAAETVLFVGYGYETIASFEAALAGDGHDSVLGNSADNTLFGGAGNDTIYGEAGDDFINGQSGNNQMFGGLGNDTITATNGNDSSDGGDGDDLIYGSLGDDSFAGGNGFDTLDFSYSANHFSIDLTAGTVVFDTGFTEYLSGFEAIVGGSGNNVLTGAADANAIDGAAGNDTIAGLAGSDTLTGGSGLDVFVFADDTASADTVTDYSEADDMLDISAWGATVFGDLTVTSDEQGTTGIYDVEVAYNGNSLHLADISAVDLGLIGSDDFIFS